MEGTAALLMRESRLIEALSEMVERYVHDGAIAESEDALTSLARRLRARIKLEEETLFPAIERKVGDPKFIETARMRRQHVVIIELLRGIDRALEDRQMAIVSGDLQELKAALKAHLEEERKVLLPLLGAEFSRCFG
jgi:iron-sulfur cluster repair protein YtfE (RIC family)